MNVRTSTRIRIANCLQIAHPVEIFLRFVVERRHQDFQRVLAMTISKSTKILAKLRFPFFLVSVVCSCSAPSWRERSSGRVVVLGEIEAVRSGHGSGCRHGCGLAVFLLTPILSK